MSEEIEEVEEVVTETEKEQPIQLTEVEQIAEKMGWSPKDKWRGDETLWRSAPEFIAKTADINKELKGRLDRTERDFEDRNRRTETMAERAITLAREQAETKYRDQMREAAKVGDTETYDAAEKGLDKTRKDFTAEPVEPSTRRSPQQTGEVAEFAARNTWLGTDEVMTGAAVAIEAKLNKDYPDLPVASRLAMVENRIKQEFPHKFKGNGDGRDDPRPPGMEGGLRTIRTVTKKGWDQLPPDAKEQGEKFVRQGLFDKDPVKARAKYAEEYFAQG